MIKLICSALVGFSALGITSNIVSSNITNDINIESLNENITNIEWHNNKSLLNQDDEELFEKYDVNALEASNSSDVYIQEEYLSFDEIVKTNEFYNDNNLTTISGNQSSEFTHNKGYIKFITKAYNIGFYDGGIVYHIEVTTEQQKSFVINKNDNLIIRHGDNSVTLNLEDYKAKGERYTPCNIYSSYSPNSPINADEYESLDPNYSCSDGGVYYTFKAGGSTVTGDLTVIYGKTKVTGDYYMVSTGTTEVQPVYVHNYNWFVDSLSISFGRIGVSINTDSNSDVMEGTTMTLKGYNSRIVHSTYKITPDDWGFDARYYFVNEGIKSSTIKLNDLEIESKRLRCGYIEEEYINLSPNRIDAGDAYLELRFNKTIYEFSTNLSFWSSSEHLFKPDGDYAYIEYLDSNGDWITLVDLLDSDLPTDRKNQKYFEFDFIEGTYGIRFVAHKENPSSERNKGRVCIGETKFVTYKID